MDWTTATGIIASVLTSLGLPGTTIALIIGWLSTICLIATAVMTQLPVPTAESSKWYYDLWHALHFLADWRKPSVPVPTPTTPPAA